MAHDWLSGKNRARAEAARAVDMDLIAIAHKAMEVK